jgi:hypothetical protein
MGLIDVPLMGVRRSFLISVFTVSLLVSYQTLPCAGDPLFRVQPSTPEKLLRDVYNNVLVGNDRLNDIEGYMSHGLNGEYKRVIKNVRRGKTCDIPRILSGGIFSGKVKGFKVDLAKQEGALADLNVKIDTDAENLEQGSQLRKFDPNVYEVVKFSLVKQFVDWKIDDISASVPDFTTSSKGVNYRSVDLRDALRACQ